jgi:hypothetical protein
MVRISTLASKTLLDFVYEFSVDVKSHSHFLKFGSLSRLIRMTEQVELNNFNTTKQRIKFRQTNDESNKSNGSTIKQRMKIYKV